jgi:hypothetical protein
LPHNTFSSYFDNVDGSFSGLDGSSIFFVRLLPVSFFSYFHFSSKWRWTPCFCSNNSSSVIKKKPTALWLRSKCLWTSVWTTKSKIWFERNFEQNFANVRFSEKNSRSSRNRRRLPKSILWQKMRLCRTNSDGMLKSV